MEESIRRNLAGLALSFALAGMAFALARPVTTIGALLPACTTEDDSACVWDAAAHGNGIGRSFVQIAGRTLYQD